MLSLLSHGKLAPMQKDPPRMPQTEETKTILATLGKVAEAVKEKLPASMDDTPMNDAVPVDEWVGIKPWDDRQRKIL